jgi:Carboxypeptidase regulatory-like domain
VFTRIVSWIASAFTIATVLSFFAASLPAQTISGDLTGSIFDASGAIVANATITAKNDSTGVEATTKTTATGEYRFSNLPAGSYTVTVSASGFNQTQTKGVQVVLSQTQTANFTLQVGGTTQTVEVKEAAATIDTTTAQVQQTFGSEQLAELPMASSGSGVINLSLLNAGVSTAGAVGAGMGPTVGGMRPRNNNFTIEGIDNNNGSVTGPLVTLPNDAVAEFTVLQNQFSPEFGHSSGGQFNQIVKSGTNEIHGAAYEYLENRNLNAADNLSFIDGNPLHPRFDNNRFGGTVGGPIRKNKLFYFVNYEYNPIGSTASGGLIYAPTSAGYSTLAGIAGINQTNLSQMKQYLGTASAAAPPSAVGGAYPLIYNANESLGWTAAQTAAAVSIPIGQISVAPPSFTNNENALVSIDDTISDKDNLRVRFVLNRSGTIDTAASLPVFFQTVPTNAYLTTFSEYHTFTPTLTNEFRLGYNRYSNNTPTGNFQFPGLDAFPNLTIYELGINIGPDPNGPQFTFQNTYQMTDNVSWTRGNHSFKFGFEGWRNISPQSFTQRSRGDYEWSYLSDYLFDFNPDYLAQRSLGNVVYYGNRWLVGGYVNDTWKVSPNLTVNLGVRLEHETVPLSEHTQVLNAVSNTPGVITFQNPQAQRIAPMPRIGLAYSPGKSGNTSIRAGFGINYDVRYDNQGILSLPPELTTTVDVTGLNQQGFLAGGGIAPNASGTALTPAELRAGTGAYIPNEVRPKSLQWNIGIQHVFHNNYTFETRYLGTRGIHLPVQDQLNRQPVVNASDALPVYFSAPSQATLNGLTNTLSALTTAYNNGGNIVPGFLAAGFTGVITSYQPWGNSTYHGWANQLTRRFTNGLQLLATYTLSHAIDDSTADVFSTYVTPRRPQDARNLTPDRSDSALDHRNRVTAEMLYDFRPFKNGNWIMKNIVGNWELAPIYTYQTGTLATIQSGVDSNLNGDSAGDRTIVNPSGNPNIGSGTTPLTNSAGQTVAFLVTNPNAGYVAAPKGTLATGGRNTAHLRPIDDVDMTFGKAFNLGHEGRYKLQFQARFINIFNHPQYTGGFLTDVAPAGGVTSTNVHNFLIPGNPLFGDPTQVFSSNPRSSQIAAKLIF